MQNQLNHIKSIIYDPCGFKISNLQQEQESQDYDACLFTINDKEVRCRTAKITPKKNGQFVTFWKREDNGPIEPFNESDAIDLFVVNVKTEHEFGQFVFPKNLLIQKGIISTVAKEGKRAFRVYPSWDSPQSKQSIKSQKWQLDYFYTINDSTDLAKVKQLYQLV